MESTIRSVAAGDYRLGTGNTRPVTPGSSAALGRPPPVPGSRESVEWVDLRSPQEGGLISRSMTESSMNPLQRRLRTAARASLYAGFATTLLLGGLVWTLLADDFRIIFSHWYDVDFLEYESVRDLQSLVRIDTTHETGREMDAALWLAEQLEAIGVEPTIEDMGNGKANLWARIEGQSPETLILHSHLDTDPVGDADLWEFDPWSGHVDLVWLFGRGSFDMKSTVVAQLHSMRAVARRVAETGERPQRSLMMLVTSSEETGSHEGAQHIVANRPELLEDAWALLSEGGVVEAIDENRVRYMGISFGQKRFLDVWYEAPERSLLDDVAREIQSRGQPTRLRVVPPVRLFLEHYASTRIDVELRRGLEAPDELIADPEHFEAIPEFYRSFFRDEVHILEPEPTADGYRMRVVLHLLPDGNPDELMPFLPDGDELPPGVTRWIDPSLGSTTHSDPTHPAFRHLQTQLAQVEGAQKVGPYYLSMFANDAQFFRKLGVPSFGFQPFLAISAESFTVGRTDERIGLPTFIEGVDRYVELILELVDLET